MTKTIKTLALCLIAANANAQAGLPTYFGAINHKSLGYADYADVPDYEVGSQGWHDMQCCLAVRYNTQNPDRPSWPANCNDFERYQRMTETAMCETLAGVSMAESFNAIETAGGE